MVIVLSDITLKKIAKDDLLDLYNIMYSSQIPEWTKYNAPYFNEYKFLNYEHFLISKEVSFVLSGRVLGIFYKNKIIGIVTRYWENKDTRWLEIGIVIYDENFWNKGIATKVLFDWIEKCFIDFPEIERVGLTTWSGNKGMMRTAEKLNMTQEARIRKVRYYQGYYYDSVKYGILREEFFSKVTKAEDCTFPVQNDIFNYRVAALLKKDNKILLTKHLNGDYCFLPGGRVKILENSKEALRRELAEELSLTFDELKLTLINENFFLNNDKRYHEITFYYLINITSKNEINSLGEEFIVSDEENKQYEYKWMAIDEIKKINLKPEFLKQDFNKYLHSDIVNHIINDEIN